MAKNFKRDLELLFEIGSLNNMRGWRQHLNMDTASVSEHTFRIIWLALLIARKEGAGDENKIIRMALVHDVAESRVSDLSYVQKVYVTANEDAAIQDTLRDTSFEDFLDLVEEFEKRESIESKIVKDADNLDVDIELKELEERGSRAPKKWTMNREKVRNEHLYTETARAIWDAIQSADPADWHLAANKHVMPKKG